MARPIHGFAVQRSRLRRDHRRGDLSPNGFRFGTIRFTPDEVAENNDEESLVGERTEEPIQLDTSGDTDNSVMLHVYNFAAGMPGTDTAAEESTTGQSSWLRRTDRGYDRAVVVTVSNLHEGG